MKTSILKIFGCIALLSILTGCKKDTVLEQEIVDDNTAIRILKVSFNEGTHRYFYHYDNLGKLSYVYHDVDSGINIIDTTRLKTEYGDKWIYLENDYGGHDDNEWNWTKIFKSNNRVDSLFTLTPLTGAVPVPSVSLLKFKRSDNMEIIEIIRDRGIQGTYSPILIEVVSSNSNGLPENIKSTNAIKDVIINKTFKVKINYQYTYSPEIPTYLKRLINEELLYLNRYGITRFDLGYICGIYDKPLNHYGDGNWLISFGLPQYYILEEKSQYMVSKRTTDIYQINEAGEEEYERTITEDFPYIHDAEAKTLEIAGLKIWYEYVEKEESL
ncbi:MAG: hypothetical protein M9958_08955 [Chitinophagales bacterium]|nr:hypothetical protein [Chitinophagales bacterium]